MSKTKQNHTILYAPGMEEMALGIAAIVEGATALCTTDILKGTAPTFCTALCWENFPVPIWRPRPQTSHERREGQARHNADEP